MNEVSHRVSDWFTDGKRVVLSTLVETEGPSPRDEGAMFAVSSEHDLAGAIHAAAAQTPLVILLEDIHWADNGTLLALRSLATVRPDFAVLWVLTARTGAGGPALNGNLDIEVTVPDNWSGRLYQQGGGGFDTGLNFTLSMGCGTWGGNSITDNLNYMNFLNITHLVTTIPEDKPSEEDLFGGYWAKYGK